MEERIWHEPPRAQRGQGLSGYLDKRKDATMDARNNVKCVVDGHILTITIDLNADTVPSKSGKSELVATTGGAVNINGYMVGLNVYKPAKN